MADERDPECVARWPECITFGYDPRCCRWPKSCSAGEVVPDSLNTGSDAGANLVRRPPPPATQEEPAMSVSARFFVREVVMHATRVSGSGWAEPAPNITVKLAVVSGAKGAANKAWASATPSGEITMVIGNPDAAQWFIDRLSQDIAVTFEDRPADEME